MKTKKPLTPHRIFLTRHYIAVQWYDVMATDPNHAATIAKKAAQKHYPDPRMQATDNHWQASEEATPIKAIGFPSPDTYRMHETEPGSGVFEAPAPSPTPASPPGVG